jgi:plasmid stability protein
MEVVMASLTIRNLEEETKRTLRLRAARHGKSLEEEVRVILRRAAREDDKPKRRHANLYDAIRELAEPFGGFELEVPERSLPHRDPPTFD